MTQMWGHVKDFNGDWEAWKAGKFKDLKLDDMDQAAGQYQKKVIKLKKKLERWPVWQALRNRLQQFISTMPLINDLKSPALRPRHWALLKKEIGKDFDQDADSFTLERVFTLRLDNAAEFIGELSANANKELSIEENLQGDDA